MLGGSPVEISTTSLSTTSLSTMEDQAGRSVELIDRESRSNTTVPVNTTVAGFVELAELRAF
jgi:hypothetical protein